MPKYAVTMHATLRAQYTVEAEDIDEARKKTWELATLYNDSSYREIGELTSKTMQVERINA